MSDNETAGAPYRQIVDDLRQQIRSGELGEGDRLPSQSKLASTYGVTRVTVAKAISALAAEGLVSTRAGSGAYVRAFERILRSSPRRLSASWWGSGHAVQDADTGVRPRSLGVKVVITPAPDDIARQMGLAPGTPTVQRTRRFVVDDDRAVQLATSWYPADIAENTAIANEDTGPGGSPARLAEVGHAPRRHAERIVVRMPSPAEIKALTLLPGTPVAQILRLSYDAAGRCVEATLMVLDGSAYELEYVFES
jgi:GntR family transcriptional regulator